MKRDTPPHSLPSEAETAGDVAKGPPASAANPLLDNLSCYIPPTARSPHPCPSPLVLEARATREKSPDTDMASWPWGVGSRSEPGSRGLRWEILVPTGSQATGPGSREVSRGASWSEVCREQKSGANYATFPVHRTWSPSDRFHYLQRGKRPRIPSCLARSALNVMPKEPENATQLQQLPLRREGGTGMPFSNSGGLLVWRRAFFFLVRPPYIYSSP
eukprot:gene11955-biopygen22931